MHVNVKGGKRKITAPAALPAMVALILQWPAPGLCGKSFRQNPDRTFERLAKSSRRGLYPRGFSGEQAYWTLVGVDGGGAHSALVSSDGSVEPARGGFSLEPFLAADGRLLTWADVVSTQELEDGYLPIPKVTWKAPGWRLSIHAFASGDTADSRLHVDYTLTNRGDHAGRATLVLAVRPFQVDPPTQFLNTKGGFSPIYRIEWRGGAVRVNDKVGFFALEKPDEFIASAFTSGDIISARAPGHASARPASDPSGRASGAMRFGLSLGPRQSQTIHLLFPLSGATELPEAATRDPENWTARKRRSVASKWRAVLNTVGIRVPPSARWIVDTLRTSLASILMSRNGPALQPGTRSYARTWIRDGAMMSEALLRMDKQAIVRDFIDWYAPFQFQSGKAPCCVDARGADPTPENDSQGEFVFTVAELYRFTHDKARLEALWPHVLLAIDYMDRLRAKEKKPAEPSDFGLMPASISHEGYCKKPMHSYWDDFWSLKGYDDAGYLARKLGKPDQDRRIAASRDQFRNDLLASIRRSAALHKIDYVPGCAELGDFDPTSSTIALSPTGESAYLPKRILEGTFERYWHNFSAPRKAYTPYELRMVGAFIRLGWRNRVQPLLDFFRKGRRPAAWNGWAEAVRRDSKKPGFIGDMPHAWIASDFIGSVLDMFAYRRPADSAMVLGAGIPTAWLSGQGAALSGLTTPWGRLSYSLRREKNLLRLRIDSAALPPGGFILPWPYSGAPGKIVSAPRQVFWRGTELHIDAAPAVVTIALGDGD